MGDDGDKLRVDFGAGVVDLHWKDRTPGALQILQPADHHALDHAVFDFGEIPPLCLHLQFSRASEKKINQREDQAGLQHHDRIAPQWGHPEKVHGRRNRQRLEEFSELDEFGGAHADVHHLAQRVGKREPEEPDEAIMDDLQGRHTPPDDAVLRRQVKGHDLGRVVLLIILFLNAQIVAGDSLKERVNLFLCQNRCHPVSLVVGLSGCVIRVI